MTRPAFLSALDGRRWTLPSTLLLFAVLALPAVRHWLEASMTRHMLLQFPLLALVGYGLASALPTRWAQGIHRWNEEGITGLFGLALALAVLMIPRVLDLALVNTRIELAKWCVLLLCGAALKLSWRPAGWLVQGFFLGNVLPMTIVIGYLFESSPVRVCNAYLLDDQERLGQRLIWIAAAIALVWFAALIRTLMKNDSALTDALPQTATPTGAHRSGAP